MQILKTQTLRGPNYWSIRHTKLIVVRLDLEELAERPSDTIPGFYDGLVEALPSLIEHFCSPGCRGGFLSRVKEGTMMGHIMEHIALELQTLAGMSVGFGRTRETDTDGIYQVVFAYEYEKAGRYAARAAFRICQSIIETGHYPKEELAQDLADLAELKIESSLGPSTEAIVKAAEARGIPWIPLETRELLQLGYGRYQHRIQAALTSQSSILGVELSCDKEGTKQILKDAGVPVPLGTLIYSYKELEDAIESLGGYPIVIKPLNGNHGRGITLNIQSWEDAEEAYDLAREVSDGVIVEHYYQGRDFRILVVNHRFVAAAERVPAHVVGNGKNTVEELVEQENLDPRRGTGHDNILTQITFDQATSVMLTQQGLTRETILEKDQVCFLRATANLSTGGVAIDRTDDVHPSTVWMAERVSRIIGLDIAGIDVISSDITQPLKEVQGAIVEVNAAPGLRMHLAPSEGTPRNVAEPIIDMLFPPGQPTRVPIVSVTGTNGKTTTTRLIAHLCRPHFESVGYTTTDGIYINEHLIEKGDTTGPYSAQVILKDPVVELAVLETARGGILRSGLAFNHCDVGVVLNVDADHLGLGDINTISQMAKLKAVVAEAVHEHGYAILNADDERVAAMADAVKSKVAYFSMREDNPIVQAHVASGGLAAIYKKGHLTLVKEDWEHRIARAKKLPLTLGGHAHFMIANALAASLAAFVQQVSPEHIRDGLKSFRVSADQTPGRMNLFAFDNHHALVDYAHNPAGYKAVGEFVKSWSGPTIGVVGGPGDRRDSDLRELGTLAASFLDEIIVKEDDDTRGRPQGEAANLVIQGIEEYNQTAKAEVPFSLRLNETEAIEWALDHAPDKSLIVIFPESVSRAIALIKERNPQSETAELSSTSDASV